MALIVRPARETDLPAIVELYGTVCDALQGKAYNPGWARDSFPTLDCAREYLREGALLIAMEGSEPVGSVGLTREPSAEDGFENAPDFDDKVWYLHVLAVHPAHQRRGISSLLLSAAEDYSRAQGANTMRLYVWEGNAPALRAYEKSGYSCVKRDVDIGLAGFGLPRFFLYEKPL